MSRALRSVTAHWQRLVVCCVVPVVYMLSAGASPCAAFSVDIVAPSCEPVKAEPGEEVKFEAIARDDWGRT